MRRGDLFTRLFLRFVVALGIAMLVLVMLFHAFQRRIIFASWQEDLSQDTWWLARHAQLTDTTILGELARAWGQTHHGVHLRIFDADASLLADSHPGRSAPDLATSRAGSPFGHLVAVESLPAGRTLVLSRRWTPGFPAGFHGELLAAALALCGLVAALLLPFVRSLSRDLRRLQTVAGEVSAGQLGRTVGVERSDELGELIRAFDEMSTRLAEAERSNTRLLHDVSHELRSPLGRIRVLADSVSARPAEAEPYLDAVREEVALLDRLVGDLLDTARLEATPRLATEPIELRAWGHDLAARLGREPSARGVHWRADLPAEPAWVSGDPQRLAQAAANLVDNAMAALGDAREPSITLAISLDDDARWSLEVADSGHGIPEADLPHVTRRFYRVDRARTRSADRAGGVGLGLALTRAIAEAHGGTLALTSPVGEGTRARLRLPVAPPEPAP